MHAMCDSRAGDGRDDGRSLTQQCRNLRRQSRDRPHRARRRGAAGRTRRARVHEDGSLRVRFPNATGDALEAVIVNTGGGMTGGDRFAIEIALGEGAQLIAGSAAAEKIYRSTGPAAEMTLKLELGAGADSPGCRRKPFCSTARGWRAASTSSLPTAPRCCWPKRWCSAAPPWARRWSRGFSPTAGACAAPAGSFSPTVRGSTARWRRSSRAPAAAAGGIAIATVLVAPAGEGTLASLRALEFAGEVGISAWNGIAVARLVARDGAALRHDLIAVLAALGAQVPRLWLQ